MESRRGLSDREYLHQLKSDSFSRIMQGFDSIRRGIETHESLSAPTLLLEVEFKQACIHDYMTFDDVLAFNTKLGIMRNLANWGEWDKALSKLVELKKSVESKW